MSSMNQVRWTLAISSLAGAMLCACGDDSLGSAYSGADSGDAASSSADGGSDAGTLTAPEPDTGDSSIAETDAGDSTLGDASLAADTSEGDDAGSPEDAVVNDTAAPGDVAMDGGAGADTSTEADSGADIAAPMVCEDPTVDDGDGGCVVNTDDVDLFLWLDAAVVSSITTDDVEVTEWTDRRYPDGGSMVFTSNIQNAKPTLHQPSWNGLPTIYFDGSAQLRAGDVPWLAGVQEFTLFVVSSSTGDGDRPLITGITPAGLSMQVSYAVDSSRASFHYNGAPVKGGGATVSIVNLLPGVPTILMAERKQGDSPSLSLSGANAIGVAGSAEVVLANTADIGTAIDLYLCQAVEGLDGHIAEVLFFRRAFAKSEADAVQSYLTAKWGMVQ